jgi:hypothetical protein
VIVWKNILIDRSQRIIPLKPKKTSMPIDILTPATRDQTSRSNNGDSPFAAPTAFASGKKQS